MPNRRFISENRSPVRTVRITALLIASLLLHVIAINWANGRLGIPSLQDTAPTVVTTALLTPPLSQPAAPPPPKPAPPPKKKAKPPRPASAPVPVPVSTPIAPTASPAADDAVVALPTNGPEPTQAGTASDAVAAAPSAPTKSETGAPNTAAPAAVRYKVSPPPSAELAYEVNAMRDGQTWHGNGLFRWATDGANYTITGEASVTILFKITVLNFKSEGTINDFGVAPLLYSEKPWRKSAMNTHFQQENRKISFSASEAVYPYHGGEQDRASVMWQLAGIGRADAAQFAPGAQIDLVVAGTRDADTWRIQVVRQEDIDTPFGVVSAWHVVRAPRPGSYDQKIDIWLAPQHEWYPVKLRYTYANGDHLDMLLSKVSPATAQATVQ